MTVPPELPGPNSGVSDSNAAHARGGQPPHLQLRLDLMDAVRRVVCRKHLRQRDAAALFGAAPPRVSDLVRGKEALVRIDTLVGMLAALGVNVRVELQSDRTTANVRQAADSRHPSRSHRQRSDAEFGASE